MDFYLEDLLLLSSKHVSLGILQKSFFPETFSLKIIKIKIKINRRCYNNYRV